MSDSGAPDCPVVQLEGVRVIRGARVLLDVAALSVRRGEVLVAMGPNGAGKSTLIRVLGLLESPSAGTVRFDGQPVPKTPPLVLRRRTAAALQEPLLADGSVADNVAMGLRFRGEPRAGIERRVSRWLGRLGIAGLADRRARTLSGGEAQRTALARALVLEPELLLLDEPFAALDQPTRESFIADLAAILREDRTTTVLVTHDRGEALALADRMAVLIAGRLQQVGEATAVWRAPVSEAVARFVGVETIVDCRVLERHPELTVLGAGDRTLEVAQAAPPGEWVRLCLRPEDVTVSVPGRGAPTGARNVLPGRVARLVPAGGQLRAVLDCGVPIVALITHRSARGLDLREGTAVAVHFEANAAHLLPGTAPRLDSASGPAV
jgi:tungstate transport system ATP-binding protein